MRVEGTPCLFVPTTWGILDQWSWVVQPYFNAKQSPCHDSGWWLKWTDTMRNEVFTCERNNDSTLKFKLVSFRLRQIENAWHYSGNINGNFFHWLTWLYLTFLHFFYSLDIYLNFTVNSRFFQQKNTLLSPVWLCWTPSKQWTRKNLFGTKLCTHEHIWVRWKGGVCLSPKHSHSPPALTWSA